MYVRQVIGILLLFLFLQAFNVKAQAPSSILGIPKKEYHTQRVNSSELVFDGKLDDIAWQKVEKTSNFVQYEPEENHPPSHPSEFQIVYDDKYLYLGYRCYDPAPDSIVRWMSRRDEFPGDWIEVNIDSYHDLRTAFSFTFSVSGVRGDEFISNNGNNWDTNWNPIWDGKSHIDSLGWTAEIKIPFSQLRYGNAKEPVWGIQVQRRIFRKEERSVWQRIPRNSGGWVSQFGELHGLRDLPNTKGIEIAPYILAKTSHYEKEEGNPFADGSDQTVTAGIDGKLAVTRDLILDYTVNPDFGQVEADPGAVRLDGYEVFFSERRPFFLESRNLFDYSITGSALGNSFDSDLLFYSRRIGGAPNSYPSLSNDEYADVPQVTPILGAVKFSGKTQKGLSVGILESVGKRVHARIDNNGEVRKELVEPLTSYFVGRVMQDYQQGNTIIGAVLSSVNREKGIGWLHDNAYSGGLDFQRFWKNRCYQLKANLIFSHVQGSPEAINETQNGFVHYFQRPNATHLKVDNKRTALTGTGGTVAIGKFGGKPDKRGGVLNFQTGATYRSPELELNDIGFLRSADEINNFTWIGYNIQKPFSIFRQFRVNFNNSQRWDFGGQFTNSDLGVNAHATYLNNWNTGIGVGYNPLDISNNALRGGSSLRRPAGMGTWAYINTDGRKKVQFSLEGNYAWGFDNTVKYQGISAGVEFQPLNALKVSIYPGYDYSWRRQDQYVAQADYNNARRTIVSEVDQQSFSITTRINYNLTPDLTIQYYGQPFIYRAKYNNYAFVTDPLNRAYDARFQVYKGAEIAQDGDDFNIDENKDGVVDYSFSKPDFNFIQFRSNLVVRWEYVPGSEFYLVWSQSATPDAYEDLKSPLANSLFNNIFDKQPQNIFLVKMMYRLVR